MFHMTLFRKTLITFWMTQMARIEPICRLLLYELSSFYVFHKCFWTVVCSAIMRVFVCVCLFFLIFQTGRVYTFRVQHVNTFIQVIPTTRHTLTRAIELWNSVKNEPVNQLFSQVILHFTHVLCIAETDGSTRRCLSDACVFLLHLHCMTCKIRQKTEGRQDKCKHTWTTELVGGNICSNLVLSDIPDGDGK